MNEVLSSVREWIAQTVSSAISGIKWIVGKAAAWFIVALVGLLALYGIGVPGFPFEPEPTPEPTAIVEPTEEPTAIVPTATLTPTITVEPTVIITPTAITTPTVIIKPTQVITPTVEIEPTKAVTPTVEVEPTKDDGTATTPPTATETPIIIIIDPIPAETLTPTATVAHGGSPLVTPTDD